MAGELESGAQRIEIGQHLQSLVRTLCDRAGRRGSEIGVGAGLGPADASAELIELGEAEAVGAVDDEGVRRGDVEAAFDDGRRKEHIIFAVVEIGSTSCRERVCSYG